MTIRASRSVWRPARTNAGPRSRPAWCPRSSVTACLGAWCSTTARRGATGRAIPTPRSGSGCCAWASPSATAAPITPRPWARTSASTARSRPVLQGRRFRDLAHCRQAFAAWRHVYNLERPHEALDMAVPAAATGPARAPIRRRSRPSNTPPAIACERSSTAAASTSWARWRLPKAFRGYPLALRPTPRDGIWKVFFMTHGSNLRRSEDHHQGTCPRTLVNLASRGGGSGWG